MRIDLTGKVALVTGSAHRVGKAIALELAAHGVHQVIHYFQSETKAIQTEQEIQNLGVKTLRMGSDLGDPKQIATLFEAIRERFGHLDILVNSASVFEKSSLPNVALDEWTRSLNVNLSAPMLCMQAAVRLMPETGGAVVNILDMNALKGNPNRVSHSVSKAGLLMLTQLAARTLAPHIRVNAVVPGPVLISPTATAEQWEQHGIKLPVKRVGTVEDVARGVVYLVSEDFITGEILTVDGGEHLL